jgi:riboflavin synthase
LAASAGARGKTMFTGLIQERGTILGDPLLSGRGGVRLAIGLSRDLAAGLGAGFSLAVSGVCLTVLELTEVLAGPRPAPAGAPADQPAPPAAGIAVILELAPETVSRTTLGRLRAGSEVNLEPPLRAGEPLGGHLVQGHVDNTAEVVARRDLGEHRVLGFSLPAALAPFLVEKGSVTVDGVSLTVAALDDDRFEVALLPHTLAVTTLGALGPGDAVNLEVDVLAKYVQRMLAARGLVPEPAATPGTAAR